MVRSKPAGSCYHQSGLALFLVAGQARYKAPVTAVVGRPVLSHTSRLFLVPITVRALIHHACRDWYRCSLERFLNCSGDLLFPQWQ
jgi:hypothetical protein